MLSYDLKSCKRNHKQDTACEGPKGHQYNSVPPSFLVAPRFLKSATPLHFPHIFSICNQAMEWH